MNDTETLRRNLADFFSRVSDADLAVVLSQLGLQLARRGVSGCGALQRSALELDHRVRFATTPPAEVFPPSSIRS